MASKSALVQSALEPRQNLRRLSLGLAALLSVATTWGATTTLPNSGAATVNVTAVATEAASVPSPFNRLDYWLRRMTAAAQHETYSGLLIQRSGNELHSSRISHSGESGVELVEPLYGAPRIQMRYANAMQTVLPHASLVLMEQYDSSVASTGDLLAPLAGASQPELAERNYQVAAVRTDNCLGRVCDLVKLKPRDHHRWARRWWLDRATGLLLKAQTLGEAHQVQDEVAFTEVQFGALQPATPLPEAGELVAQTVRATEVDAARQGWSAKPPEGFVAAGSWRREKQERVLPPAASMASAATLPASTAKPAAAKRTRTVWQWDFHDGLARISLFLDPEPSQKGATLRRSLGATSVFSMRRGRWLITGVGEAPPATVERLVRSVEIKTAAVGAASVPR